MKITNQSSTNTGEVSEPADYEIILASLFFLMTRYARQPDHRVASGIIDHLERLARHPHQDSAFMVRTCTRLMNQWSDLCSDRSFSKHLTPGYLYARSDTPLH